MTKQLTRRRFVRATAAAGALAAFPAPSLWAQGAATKMRIGIVPLISSGPIFIAEARKYFEKVKLDVDIQYFKDGALAMPALVAGELDATATTLNAGLFNAFAKGAPYKLVLDRGIGEARLRLDDDRRLERDGRSRHDRAAKDGAAQGQKDRDPGARLRSTNICSGSAYRSSGSTLVPTSNGRRAWAIRIW